VGASEKPEAFDNVFKKVKRKADRSMGRGGIVVLGILFFVAAMACFVASSLVACKILPLVNSRLPAADQFEPFTWWHGKQLRLLREYRRLYPGGALVRTHLLLSLAGVGFFLLAIMLFEHSHSWAGLAQ